MLQWRPQAIVFEIVTDKKFDMIIMLFIGLNMLTMTLDHYQQSATFSNVLDYLNMIFIVIFSSECLLKIFALRYHYFVEPWNLFDFVVVMFSILSEYTSFEIKTFKSNPLCNLHFVCRFGAERYYRKVFCISDVIESSESSKSRSCTSISKRRQGYSNPAIRASHVTACSIQYLSFAFPCHVHLRHIRHVLFHACQRQRRPG
jgi:hypothetical protein